MMFRKFLYLALICAACVACSPQQRLTRLLTHHPELRGRDTLIRRELTVPIPGMQRNTTVNLGTDPCNCDSILQAAIGDSLTVQAGNASATLTHQPGQITLTAQQKPDTIYQTVEVEVPVVEYVEVERKEKPVESFCRISGIILWALLALMIIIHTIKHFLV